ncbi:MAG: PilT/PilU family type 4a pilus ATPase [Phycisphaerales bacterium]
MLGALTISRLLSKMKEVEASDLHLKVGSPPVFRVGGDLRHIECPALNAEDLEQLLAPIIPAHLRSTLDTRGGIDFSHHETAEHRFRCSVFHAGHALHAAIRRVNPVIPSFEGLHLPPVYERVVSHTNEGLILICGVTGSGKSSTLAAMLDYINRTQSCNIITVEDPVEYLFRPAKSFVSQREIGIDVPDFASALRAAVRQDPDVIMIGEMRDRETMLAAIQAAETGHLVFATLHTADTMQSFSRILEFFDVKDHAFIRSSLAAGLQAVMAQRLLPSVKKGVPRVPATEVLLRNSTVADKIREGLDDDLPAVMAGCASEGMHDFTTSLTELVEKDWVDLRVAERYAPNVEALRARVRGIAVKAETLVSKARG